jgi:lactoylglutathione lyase
MSKRPFKVLGIQQIAVGGLDKDKLRTLWVDTLGLTLGGNYRSEKENVDPLNHVGLWVDDLPAAVEWLTDQGLRFAPGGIRKGASGFDVCFVHPKGNEEFPVGGEGVLIELVQAPAEVIEELG